MLRPRAVVALVVWTLLVWTGRIRNVWGDDGLDTAEKWSRTALALSFTVLAVAVIAAARWRAPAALRLTVLALAGWTTAVWLVRSVDILAGDHDAAFKIVHALLAVVSIVLSALAVRSVRPVRDAPAPVGTGGRREPVSGSGSHPRP